MTSAINEVKGMQGRKVAFFRIGGGGPTMELDIKRAREMGSRVHSAQVLIDDPFVWIVCFDVKGQEIRRYNAKNISVIQWEVE